MSDKRTCKGCGETKSLDEFQKTGKLYKDGSPKYHGKCKSCMNAYQRKHLKESPEYKKNHKKSAANWQKENKEKRNAYFKEWRKQHPEAAKEYQRRWRAKNTPKTSASWKKRNTERKAIDPEYAKTRLEYRRSRTLRLKGVGGSHTVAEWEALKVATGNKCLCCGVSGDETELTRDHVLPITKGGTDNIDNIQPLCLSCNAKKQANHIDYRKG